MTDSAACESLLSRLAAANWDDDAAALRRAASRGQLAAEYLRRMAVWAEALGVPGKGPFFDLAVMFDPAVLTDPVWMQRLEAGIGHRLGTMSTKVVTDMFRWASLGDRTKERFPTFEEPYEPMVQLFERGGEIWPGHREIEFYGGSLPFRGIAERLAQAPFRIDTVALDELDENERVRTEQLRAHPAVTHAQQVAEQRRLTRTRDPVPDCVAGGYRQPLLKQAIERLTPLSSIGDDPAYQRSALLHGCQLARAYLLRRDLEGTVETARVALGRLAEVQSGRCVASLRDLRRSLAQRQRATVVAEFLPELDAALGAVTNSPTGDDRAYGDDAGTPTELRPRRYDDHDAQFLVKALYAEQFDTYSFADSPDSEIADDYAEPSGLLLVAYAPSGQPVGCGGYRTYDKDARVAEVRKMFVTSEYRSHGLGWRILSELERHATVHGVRTILLETGALNYAAIRLYIAAGYEPIPPYVSGRRETNRAFRKTLDP
ncbi:ribosomal protein S18 acetylase RimI-like enzyme [Kribbella sp. VKM Ac-2571]|uniref:GNAT family N-acetyltransferase n=1 Tax=Kribbella sp. VKM Ac-2571 TaxID=2512222 RepID=UPI0010D08F39|nr:GNAT family N-acetyltransferase [Kribbella sp. VKM Ac-2571]TDO66550.1 ribosomal protein S18 acetylase RimI-like enzyme [Kribbella sp. VKM Ac-2571]